MAAKSSTSRAFHIDITHSLRRDGTLKVTAEISDPDVTRAIIEYLKMLTAIVATKSAKAPSGYFGHCYWLIRADRGSFFRRFGCPQWGVITVVSDTAYQDTVLRHHTQSTLLSVKALL
ncbi:MAG: hypothetical protein AAF515_05425 [Pseudomonadota bacterium]